MKKTLQTLIILTSLCFGLNAVAAGGDCANEEHYPLISHAALTQSIQAKSITVIDVNSQDSFNKNHVTGAFHYGSHESDFDKLLPAKKDAQIVAYCGGPKCGAWKKAAERACEQGYTNIFHYKDGISGWVKAEKKAS
ncbi:MAG: rhodanese-like domain-containing protein [Bdellovibrionia bacterium]